MKIVHLCLGSFYIDNYSYQENLLPKFHKKLGYDVEIYASLETFNKNGERTYFKNGSTYINENGIQVTRLNYKKPLLIYKKMKRYIGLYNALKKSLPDIIFIHGLQSLDVDQVIRFIDNSEKKPIVFIDNHCDFSNSARNFFSYNILHRYFWKKMANKIKPYTRKFYGVLPTRVDFLERVYDLPSEKCELLVMGVDDDVARKATMLRRTTRKHFNLKDTDYVIITGGKIDIWKQETLNLMDAVHKMNNPNIKLLIFGSVIPELKEKFKEKLCDSKISFLGWLDSNETANVLAASDLAVFPGRHSVLWEETAGIGIPMVCRFWEGTNDIDLKGNMLYLKHGTVAEIKEKISLILNSKNVLNSMKIVAEEKKSFFSYSKIAKESIKH